MSQKRWISLCLVASCLTTLWNTKVGAFRSPLTPCRYTLSFVCVFWCVVYVLFHRVCMWVRVCVCVCPSVCVWVCSGFWKHMPLTWFGLLLGSNCRRNQGYEHLRMMSKSFAYDSRGCCLLMRSLSAVKAICQSPSLSRNHMFALPFSHLRCITATLILPLLPF